MRPFLDLEVQILFNDVLGSDLLGSWPATSALSKYVRLQKEWLKSELCIKGCL